jgi:hypothetical protein
VSENRERNLRPNTLKPQLNAAPLDWVGTIPDAAVDDFSCLTSDLGPLLLPPTPVAENQSSS